MRRFPRVGFGTYEQSAKKTGADEADEADAPGASADARPSDPVADALASLGARGVHVAWAGAEDEREAAAVALCAERFEALKKRGASAKKSAAPPGAPPGVAFAGDGAPGMIDHAPSRPRGGLLERRERRVVPRGVARARARARRRAQVARDPFQDGRA